MSSTSKYPILIATWRFFCPCGTEIKKGENYVRQDNTDMCLKCGLPARRLRPVSQNK